jgi:protein arginine N-methyltransferase 1
VYAVEATDMAKFAQRLVAAQGLEGTVEVIQGVIESVELPEKVDIIISEWMVSTAGPAGAATARSSCTAW